jgi:hypothetical protein
MLAASRAEFSNDTLQKGKKSKKKVDVKEFQAYKPR